MFGSLDTRELEYKIKSLEERVRTLENFRIGITNWLDEQGYKIQLSPPNDGYTFSIVPKDQP